MSCANTVYHRLSKWCTDWRQSVCCAWITIATR